MERAQVIVIGGEKGGVGKSTLCTNIAVELALQTANVLIMDTDPQKTSINWIDRRNELINRNENFLKIHGVSKEGNVRDTIKDFSTQYDVIMLDASGRDSKSLRTALTIADKFFCPVKPSQADLETLPHVCELVQVSKDINAKLQSFVVVSMAPTNHKVRESDDALSILKDFKNYVGISKNVIMERKVYRDALLAGKGVIELSNQKASNEIKKFVKEMLNA